MTSHPRDSLTRAIAAQEARLVELDREREAAQLELERLRSDLGALDFAATRVVAASASDPVSTMTASEKVALFRTLFRGRDDIYPKLWENARTGKKGYAPACANEWVRGVCDKPRVRCGECPNQAFLGITDEVIADHLKGRHVTGVYPLLADETCWLLAVDFDKRSWTEDVAAFAETCRGAGVPAAVERSRSGNGAHAWFFLLSPGTCDGRSEDGVLPHHQGDGAASPNQHGLI